MATIDTKELGWLILDELLIRLADKLPGWDYFSNTDIYNSHVFCIFKYDNVSVLIYLNSHHCFVCKENSDSLYIDYAMPDFFDIVISSIVRYSKLSRGFYFI